MKTILVKLIPLQLDRDILLLNEYSLANGAHCRIVDLPVCDSDSKGTHVFGKRRYRVDSCLESREEGLLVLTKETVRRLSK
jgi:hypothetical protein